MLVGIAVGLGIVVILLAFAIYFIYKLYLASRAKNLKRRAEPGHIWDLPTDVQMWRIRHSWEWESEGLWFILLQDARSNGAQLFSIVSATELRENSLYCWNGTHDALVWRDEVAQQDPTLTSSVA